MVKEKWMYRTIETDRFLLQEVTRDDGPKLCALDADPEVMRFIGPPPSSEIQWYSSRIESSYLRYHNHNWHGVWMIYDRHDVRLVHGWVYARPAIHSPIASQLDWVDPHIIEIGYRLHRHSWGRGIATECASKLIEKGLSYSNETEFVGCALETNINSLKVLRKLRMVEITRIQRSEDEVPIIVMQRAKIGDS